MDELRDAVEAAYTKEAEGGIAPPPASSETNNDTPPAKDPVPPVASPEDKGGAPKGTNEAPKPDDKPAGEAPSAAAPVAPTTQAPPKAPDVPADSHARVDRAPASWKGESKAVWSALPLHVRQEVLRRERDNEQAMREHAQTRQTLDIINQTVAPYADIIQRSYGGSPAKAVQQLFEVERILTTAPTAQKAQFVANLIKHYGVDIVALDGFLSGQAAPEHQQQINFQQMLDQRLAPVMQFVQQQQQLQQQAAQAQDNQAVQAVEQMAADTTNFPYFDEVREDMADLMDSHMRRGVPITLKDAYQKAVRMNNLTFDATSAQRAQELATQAQQQAAAAKAASSSVGGSPVPQPTTPPNPSDIHALLSAAYDNVVGNRL